MHTTVQLGMARFATLHVLHGHSYLQQGLLKALEQEPELRRDMLDRLLPMMSALGALGLSYVRLLEAPQDGGRPADPQVVAVLRPLRFVSYHLLMTVVATDAEHARQLLRLPEGRLREMTTDPQVVELLNLPARNKRPSYPAPQLVEDELARKATETMLRDMYAAVERCLGAQAGENPTVDDLFDIFEDGLQTAVDSLRLAETMENALLEGLPADPEVLRALPLLCYLAEQMLMVAIAEDARDYCELFFIDPERVAALRENPVAQAALAA